MNRRRSIATVPDDIKTSIDKLSSIPEDSVADTGIETLQKKFFPPKKSKDSSDSKPPHFFREIFNLVANACRTPTCERDRVIELLKSAKERESNVARRPDSDHLQDLSNRVASLTTSG